MEFFVEVPVAMTTDGIQSHINLSKLTDWCSSIDKIFHKEGNRALVHCEMGELHIHRELIQHGVRFSVTDLPYALQWTITSCPETKDTTLIHCTINCRECPSELVEALERFLDCWQTGIEAWLQRKAEQDKNKVCVSCGDTFGGFG